MTTLYNNTFKSSLGDENKKLLLDLESVDPLLALIAGEDRTVRRHAMMALGVLCAHRMFSLYVEY